jgi:hypothetical protein
MWFGKPRWMKLAMVAAVLSGPPLLHAQLFSDDFTRTNDPATLAPPWFGQAGTWTITGGVLKGGPNLTFSYGNAYITNSWGDYSAQAQFQFPVGAYGGGLGGRVNTTNGAHYAAWVFPEGSAGGSNVLKLLKFQTWTTFGYNGVSFAVIQQTNLASVGTNFHLVKLSFQTNVISVAYDGTPMMTATDIEATPYLSGSVSVDMWTDASAYTMAVDNVLVSPISTTPIANNDAYNAVTGRLLTIPAPGVLANDTGGSGPLRAVLVTGVSHGTFALSTNGGFTYTATGNFTGTDTFIYKASDGITNSANATVSITVTTNHPPVANNDNYGTLVNTPLTVAEPGVLGNDTDADGDSLTAVVVSNPTNGTVTLNPNGSFTYTPAPNFTGTDGFTYKANDGLANSAAATVTLTVISGGALFFDNFTRINDPGPLAPWIVQSGTWTVTGGSMVGGGDTQQTYGFAYITNSWTNYSVEGRVQFSTTSAWGGGIGGCLNPATGAHYGAWVYPDNSAGGSNVLKLIKFQTWTTFGYNGTNNGAVIQQVNLPSVGTNWHTLKMAFLTNRIAVYYDSVQLMSVSDTDTAVPPYLGGAISLDHWTYTTAYTLAIDNVIVRRLAADDAYSVNENTTLNVAAPGVLANDSGVFGANLTASLVTGTTNGTLTLNTNGAFTYTPTTLYFGPDAFIYQANDGVTNLGTATVLLTVNRVNQPPALPVQTNQTINQFTTLVVTNTGTDPDVPAEVLTYTLTVTPANSANATNAVISTNGVITFTPTQGFITNTLTTVVTDNGSPPLSATNSFTVTVNDINVAPVLPNQTNRTVNQFSLMTVTNTATDSNNPPAVLTYTLLVAPANAAISSNGVITWTPGGGQAPGTNTFTTVVSNYNARAINTQSFSATNSFVVVVNDINAPPVLPVQTNHIIAPLMTLVVTNTATDTNVPPALPLTYGLINPPAGASIDTNGIITWTPTQAQDQSTNVIKTVVTNNNPLAVNSQHVTATNTFTVFVNGRPVIVPDVTTVAAETCYPTNGAIDPGETVTVLFALKDVGLGNSTNLVATLVANSGVLSPSAPQTYGALVAGGASVAQPFSFTANGTCSGTITANLQLQDGGLNLGTASVSFVLGPLITVLTQSFDSVTAPALPSGWLTSASGVQSNWFTVSTNSDTPPNSVYSIDNTNVGVNELDSPAFFLPPGPAQLSFRHRYAFESDNNLLTNGYDGGVLELKIGSGPFVDIITNGGSFVTNGYNRKIDYRWGNPLTNRWAWSGTNAGGGFITTIVKLPATAAGQTNQLRWRVGTDNGNPGGGWWVDSIGVTVDACCTRTPPILPAQANRTNVGLATLVVTNTATDPSVPPNPLSYALTAAPVGAQIDTNGIITWTPTPSQVPSTNLFTTVVTDSWSPPMSSTNSFTNYVLAIHNGPSLLSQSNLTTIGLQTLTVTNVVIDNDLPPLPLTFSLLTAPTNAVISTNGVITWTPVAAQVPSTNVFTTVVADGGTPSLSATNSFTNYVLAVHNGPTLLAQSNRTTLGVATLTVTNVVIDNDVPPLPLTFSLLTAPSNAVISSTGVITWTPVVAQVPSTNVFTTVVADGGTPSLSATNSFTNFVLAVHNGPTLLAQSNVTTIGLETLTVTNVVEDNDVPPLPLTFSLLTAPTNAVISTNGVITWTPVVAQVPSTNVFTTVVADGGTPSLSATNSFTNFVLAVHNGPTLLAQSNVTTIGLETLTVTNVVVDNDVPPLPLTFGLLTAPSNAVISSTGVITWSPVVAQVPSTNVFTTVVADGGTPSLSATNSFTNYVLAVHNGPTLLAQSNVATIGLQTLTVTNVVVDNDIPPLPLTFSLLTAPSNAVISSAGVITWTPVVAQVPSTNVFTTVVADGGTPSLSATNSFTNYVLAIHNGPVLLAQSNRTITGQTTLIVTNVVTDNDIPPLPLTFSLLVAPSNAVISSDGVITWTPVAAQVPSTNTFTTVVTDSGSPPLSDTNTFTVTVTGSQPPPRPMIESITVSNQVVTLTWTAVPGHTYRLQFKQNTDDPNWTDIQPDIVASSTTVTATDATAPSTQRFYRVYVVPQP